MTGPRAFPHIALRYAGRQLSGLWQRTQRLTFRTPAYWATIRPQPPDDLYVVPVDPWPGDAGRGTAILEGEFSFHGRVFPLITQAGLAESWMPLGAAPEWLAELHGFRWLSDLRACGSNEARHRARDLVGTWLVSMSHWSPIAWRPDVLGTRIAAWLGHYEYLVGELSDPLRAELLRSLTLQALHLARVARTGPEGGHRFAALKGLVAATHCLLPPTKAGLRRRQQALKALEREIDEQVYADGGQIDRSPSVHLAVLRDLVEMRGTLRSGGNGVPEALQHAIDRMAPVLRYYRHADGGLGLFNDSNEDDAWRIDLVLAQSESKSKPPLAAPHVGFERLIAGKTIVLIDAGMPSHLDEHTHAGTLSFELSSGKERLIVNCGAHVPDRSEWRRVQRATAAHSTMTIDDTNSSEILGPDRLGRRPRAVTAQRDEADGAVWVDAGHDGYAERFGVFHRRRLYLSATGDDLRGEDQLIAAPQGGKSGRFAVRFHLHPRVQASLIQEGRAVLLKLPSGVGWRMRAAGGHITLADSIYLGARGTMRRSLQILIQGELQPERTIVKWAIQREGGRPK